MMTARTRLDLTNGIAVITIDSPPVNALGVDVVAELAAHVDSILSNGDIVAGVLCGANGIFSGGADIHGFGKPTPSGPTLRDVINAIDRGSKVFVAALEGIAFGGGLELAQACDYRVAQKATRVGQPEIKLGLLPGAGGTQRLPRLIGLDAALEMDVGGEPISAERAHELGLIDELVDGNVVDAAAAFARSHAARGRRRARDLELRGR